MAWFGERATLPVVVEVLLESVIRWAADRVDVRAVVLVGSQSRGTARLDSDVDLMLLVESARALVEETSWLSAFGRVVRVVVEDWGRVTSLRAWYAGGLEVEFGLATIDWATRPDEGTRRVLGDGAHVLLDRDGIFARPPSQEGEAGSSGKEGYGR